MKRVLVTGCTAMQTGSDRVQLKIVVGLQGLVNALEAAGYEVDWCPVLPGSPLDEYDRVLVTLQNPCNLASAYALSALYCLAVHPRATIVIDDWQTRETLGGLLYCHRHRGHLFGKMRARMWMADGFEPYRDAIESLIDDLATKPWPKAIAPLHDGGDPTLMGLPVERWLPYEPTSLCDHYLITDSDRAHAAQVLFERNKSSERLRAWACPSLLNRVRWAEKLGASWPIDYYGNKTTDQPRLTEDELQLLYLLYQGVLAPANPHAGSGWWRPRYYMALEAGCVVYGDPREGAILGPSFTMPIQHIEQLSTRQLNVLQRQQVREWERACWSADRLITTVRHYIENE